MPQRRSVHHAWEHPFVWDQERYAAVLALFGTGRSDYEIARITGVPRSTRPEMATQPVSDPPEAPRLQRLAADERPPLQLRTWAVPRRRPHRRSEQPAVVPKDLSRREVSVPRRRSGDELRKRLQRSSSALHLGCGEPGDPPTLEPGPPGRLPQHGPGRKHDRPIVLTAWQRELTQVHPGALVRGLIHSDGCRTINRFTTKLPSGRTQEYAYPRYFFSNESADIRAIFCEHAEVLGVRWSQSNRRNISISDKKSVAILDEVVGPKR